MGYVGKLLRQKNDKSLNALQAALFSEKMARKRHAAKKNTTACPQQWQFSNHTEPVLRGIKVGAAGRQTSEMLRDTL